MNVPARKPGRPRDEELTQRRRQDILAAAAVLFARSGYRQTDVQVVADRVGVGKGTVYRYFPSKEALFLATVDAGMQGLLSRVEAAVASTTDPLQQMTSGVMAYLGYFDQHPDMMELLIIERAEFRKRKKPTYFVYQESNQQRWHSVLKAAMDQGVIRTMPVQQVLGVMSDLLYGAIFTNYFADRRPPLEQQAHDILDTVFYGILTDQERHRRTQPKNAKRHD